VRTIQVPLKVFMKHVVVALALGVCISACGGKSSPTPTTPSSTAPTRIIALSGNMAFGNVEVGTTLTATLDIRNTGDSPLTLTGLAGPNGYTADWTSGTISAGGMQTVHVMFSPTAEQAYNGTLTVSGDQTSGTNTMNISGTGTKTPGPRTTFGAGAYLVGHDIAPGRYYSDPSSDCYWERLSGLDGSLGEILSNEFLGFDAGQWIVDILASDRAFRTDSGCSTWFPAARRGLQSDITPGMWLVGSQIAPGTYRANVAADCYWERMRHFEGTLGGIIANDHIRVAGPQLVEIRAGDAGFQSDNYCGTWTRVSPLTPALHDRTLPSSSEIQSNREMHRRKNGAR
jgi:hypothetical protein